MLENQNNLNIDLIGVIENNATILNSKKGSIVDLANQYSIPVYFDRSDLFKMPVFDYLISVQYNEILTPEEIKLAKKIAINLHMAPLPEYRGCNQFSHAIIDQAEEFGTTIHRLEASIDGGAIICERRFKIEPEEWVTDLYRRTLEQSTQLFNTNIERILNDDFELIPQQSFESTRKSSFHLRTSIRQLKQIDSTWPIEKQKRHFRATYFPGFPPPVMDSKNGEIALNMDWYNSIS